MHFHDAAESMRIEDAIRRASDIIGRDAFEQLRPHFETLLDGKVVRCARGRDLPGI